jgi:hypothetical protein
MRNVDLIRAAAHTRLTGRADPYRPASEQLILQAKLRHAHHLMRLDIHKDSCITPERTGEALVAALKRYTAFLAHVRGKCRVALSMAGC